jgi:hypothetical protein
MVLAIDFPTFNHVGARATSNVPVRLFGCDDVGHCLRIHR